MNSPSGTSRYPIRAGEGPFPAPGLVSSGHRFSTASRTSDGRGGVTRRALEAGYSFFPPKATLLPWMSCEARLRSAKPPDFNWSRLQKTNAAFQARSSPIHAVAEAHERARGSLTWDDSRLPYRVIYIGKRTRPSRVPSAAAPCPPWKVLAPWPFSPPFRLLSSHLSPQTPVTPQASASWESST